MEKNGDLPMLGPQLGMMRQFADGPNQIGSSLENLMKVMSKRDSDLNSYMAGEQHVFRFS